MIQAQKILTLILFLFALWGFGFSWFITSSLSMSQENVTQKTESLVVLTGGDKRIENALGLFQFGLSQNLFITGVHPDVSEVAIRVRWRAPSPLPECCITLGHEATTTYQNALETQKWMSAHNFKSLRLITSNYHMPRALLEFKARMPTLEIIAHPIKQPNLTYKTLNFWRIFLSEYNKFLFRKSAIMLARLSPSQPES